MTRSFKYSLLLCTALLTSAGLSGCYGSDGAQSSETGEAAQAMQVAGPARCTVEVVNGVVQQCCIERGPYGAYNNCTNFSNTYHRLCDAQGITCRSVTASCPAAGAGHAFNMTQLSNGQWCIVEPQRTGVIQPCFADPNNVSPAALCAVMGQPLNADGTCSCAVDRNSPTPLPLNTNPVSSCALDPSRVGTAPSFDAFRSCETCCVNRARYHRQNGSPDVDRWQCECSAACWSHYHPYATGHGLRNPFQCTNPPPPPPAPAPAPAPACAGAAPAAPPEGAERDGCYVCQDPNDGGPASWQWEAPCSQA